MVWCAEMLLRLMFEVGKVSKEMKDLRRVVERGFAMSRTTNRRPEEVVPELADGPVNSLDQTLLERLRDKSAQAYMVDMLMLSLLCYYIASFCTIVKHMVLCN